MKPEPSYWLVTIKVGFRIVRKGLKITPMQKGLVVDLEYVRREVMRQQNTYLLRQGGYAMPRGLILSIEPRDPAKPVAREVPLGAWQLGRVLKLPKLALSPVQQLKDKGFLKEFDGLKYVRPGAAVGN